MSSKRYYFGVGGGMFSLEEQLNKENDLHSYDIIYKCSFEDGKSNVRDISVLRKIT